MQRLAARHIPLGTRVWCRGRAYRIARITMRGAGDAGPFFDLDPLGPYPERRGVSYRLCLLEEGASRQTWWADGDPLPPWLRATVRRLEAPIPLRRRDDDHCG